MVHATEIKISFHQVLGTLQTMNDRTVILVHNQSDGAQRVLLFPKDYTRQLATIYKLSLAGFDKQCFLTSVFPDLLDLTALR